MPRYPWEQDEENENDPFYLLQEEINASKANPNPFVPSYSEKPNHYSFLEGKDPKPSELESWIPDFSSELSGNQRYQQSMDEWSKREQARKELNESLQKADGLGATRSINQNKSDIIPKDLTLPGSSKIPGVFATYDSVTKPRRTKTEMYPEVDIPIEQPGSQGGSGKLQSKISSLPPIPAVRVPEFNYPEYSELYGDDEDPESTRARRLIAYLNMAGNHIIKGLTRYDAKNDIPNAMLDSISQDQKMAANKKSRMAEYLKNKYDAYNDNYKLKMQAENMRNNALYRRALIGLKERQLSQGGQAKENSYNKEYGKMAAKGNYDFDKGGGATQGLRLIEETKQIARELRSKFYGKDGKPLQPGVLELFKKELGPGGQNWFNVEHPELAGYAQTLKRNYLNQMKTVMGERPTDKDTEVYLGTLFDWALSPQANAKNLEAKANEMKQRLMTSIAMRKHALKTGGDMSGFDPEAIPSGDIEILDE